MGRSAAGLWPYAIASMSGIGLVLGGGGVTGAAFHFGTLFAIEMATGWDPADADVVVGTSCGAVVSSILRSGPLTIEALIGEAGGREELAHTLGGRLYRKARPRGLLRWVRHGIVPGLRRPGLQLVLGSPAPYTTEGIEEWIEDHIGARANGWPSRPTIVAAFHLETRERVAFGTEGSLDIPIKRAAAASSAVPMLYEPVIIDGGRYIDGGITSGTNADLLLGSDEPLDLVIVIAPMASLEAREGARLYEGILDRLGATALGGEIDAIHCAWPDTEVLVLRPDQSVLDETRPNPLSAGAAVPSFLRTLRSMRSELARPAVWSVFERHLLAAGNR